MAAFRSEAPYLVLQDDDGIWAAFVDHSFETSDKAVIARLKKVDGVSEGPADPAEPKQD